MSAPPPKNSWVPIGVGGALDESISPVAVGGGGLTDCLNLVYERDGTWGKRSGSSVAYKVANSGAFPTNPYVSGVRWYRAYPTPLTKLVFVAGGSLWSADDIGSTPTKLLDFDAPPTEPIQFCSARDPNAKLGTGSDVLIICGGKTKLSFAKDFILITTAGPNGPGSVGQNPAPTATITLQFQRNAGSSLTPDGPSTGGSNLFEINYAILPTDNPSTIAQALSNLINQAYPVATNNVGPDPTAHNPYLCQSYVTSPSNAFDQPTGAVIHMGALFAGGDGNDITYTLSYFAGASGMGGNGSIVFTDGSGAHTPPGGGTGDYSYQSDPWTGGLVEVFSPLKWDGESPVDGLSYQVNQPFHRCTTWHDHVWLWGDKSNPDTLYATDIDQPEGFTFMQIEGGVDGGYQIGAGDSDPDVQTCEPVGNTLYIFKTNTIYVMSGYDFQSGEYQFQIQPQVQGYGVPSPGCVALLENALVFWSGRKFMRLAVGAYQPEHIGSTIPRTEGRVAQANQSRIRVVAGDFQTLSSLNDQFVANPSASPAQVMQSSIALFAFDDDDVLMYDDDATQRLGKYAWSKWNGWNVGGWIPFGLGQNSAGNGTDSPLLLWITAPDSPSSKITISQYGTDPVRDTGAAIPWLAQTGWANASSPELPKRLKRMFVQVNATSGAALKAFIIPAQTNLPNVQLTPPIDVTFDATVAPEGAEAYNILKFQIQRSVVCPAFLFSFTEDGTSDSEFEMLAYSLDSIEEAITPA